MKTFLIAALVGSTFLSPIADAATGAVTAQSSGAIAGDSNSHFARGEGRRSHGDDGGGRERGGRSDAGNNGRNERGGGRRSGGESGWQQQPHQPQQPVDRRGDRSPNADQPQPDAQAQPQWRDNRRDERRETQRSDGGWRNGDQRNDSVNNGTVQTENRDRNARNQNWDDRYGNGYDRERGNWDRNDRGHDDRYGNGWNREEGHWNDRDNRRDDSQRNGRRDDRGWNGHRDSNDRHDYQRDEHRWDNSWRNDRRYDWRGHRSQYRDHYRRPGNYYAPDRYSRYSRFSIGLTIGSGFYHQNYWLNDPWEYRLPPVHGPYRWVRYYDDVLLIDVRNGYVVDVINDFFW